MDRNKESLIRALRDPRDEVRALSAILLADDKQKDTIGDLQNALALETVPGNQVAIAYSIAELDRTAGTSALLAICNDRRKGAAARMQAAQGLLWLHDEAGLSGVIESMHAANQDVNGAELCDLFRFLPRFKNTPPLAILEIRDTASTYLTSKHLANRVAAGEALAAYGDSSSITKFDQAIGFESEILAKDAFVSDRDALELRLRTTQP